VSENKVAAEELRPGDLKSEVDNLKAENAVVRELLRKMEEQQRALLEQVDRLQRRLDGVVTAPVPPSGPQVAEIGDAANAPLPAMNPGNAPAQQASVQKPDKEDHYQDGIIIWQNPEDAKVPFLLKFNNNTQEGAGFRSTGNTTFAGSATSTPTARFPSHPHSTMVLSCRWANSSFPRRWCCMPEAQRSSDNSPARTSMPAD
jgi:hypothetical protein